jgi:hypothetical protein
VHPNARCISHGGNYGDKIFLFSFLALPLIDLILLTGIPLPQIR